MNRKINAASWQLRLPHIGENKIIKAKTLKKKLLIQTLFYKTLDEFSTTTKYKVKETLIKTILHFVSSLWQFNTEIEFLCKYL